MAQVLEHSDQNINFIKEKDKYSFHKHKMHGVHIREK